MRGRVLVPLLAIIGFSLPLAAAENSASGQGRLEGRISLQDTSRGASGSVLKAVHLDTGEVFKSQPAANDGHYELTRLPYGHYQFAIESEGRLFAVLAPVLLPPGSRQKLDFRLGKAAAPPRDGAPEEAEGAFRVPVLEQTATAVAEIEGHEKRPFLKTPGGIMTVIGGSLVLLLLI